MDNFFDDKNSYNKSSQTLFVNLIKKQRKNIRKKGNYGKLSFDDIKRVDKYLKRNIFDSSDCCIYKGELKKNYATISYKGKKVSVHRLLYHNYIGCIADGDYVTFNCNNRGICCNLKHFTMSKKKTDNYKKETNKKETNKKETDKKETKKKEN